MVIINNVACKHFSLDLALVPRTFLANDINGSVSGECVSIYFSYMHQTCLPSFM
jgi:hypothetical protein